jgi:YkoY family integral membrane protein
MESIRDFLQSAIQNYAHFFSWGDISSTLSSPASWGVIASLILLEGLLSADNALVLAVMVKHLPKKQQKKALFYGIFGAYLFRFLVIGLGSFLVKFTPIKVVGALYLLFIAYKGLFQGEGDDETENKVASFWKTVLLVELMDIAFSIDSVVAAFGVSNQVWVLFLGGVLGILMMRGVAQVFLKLLEKYPELEKTAFLLIAIIAVKMLLGVFGLDISEILFFAVLILVFIGAIVLSAVRKKTEDSRSESM